MSTAVASDSIDINDLPDKAPEYDLRELFDCGMHFGHQKAKWSPKMSEWLYMEKNGSHIFDLAKTADQLCLAYNYFYKLGKTGKTVIIVGTKRQASEVIDEVAEANKMLHITSRWLGGFLTNWDQVRGSLKRMLKLEKGLAEGEYSKYTKYEQVQLEKELSRLRRFFAGVAELKEMPEAILVIDPKREANAVREARAMGVKVVALTDSNTNPTGIDIVIPANDDAQKSIQFVVEQLTTAYLAGKSDK